MKPIKTIIIATIVTIAIIMSCACALPAGAEAADRGEFYPKLTVVVETELVTPDLWVITCEDREGNLWAFYDDEGEWDVGDIANLLMWNMGEREEDDEVIEVYWEGYTENIEDFFHVTEWRH